MKTRLLTALLTLCLVLSLSPISATTVFAASTATVNSETDLTTALNNADCTEIKLGGNIETTWELDVERTVTLDLNGYTLSCSSTDEDIIRVSSSGNLTVKDSGTGGKIDGQSKNSGFNVKGGTLTLESGTIVNCTDSDGDGGAVDVSSTGTTETPTKYGKFIMNGGAIMDCKADDDGGAVDIGNGCTFTMNGGTISGCRADDDGGAVFIKQKGTFELNGGTIQNCSAGANGGAINIYQDGSFTMTGGTIKDCEVDLGGYGNAVYGKDNTAIVAISGGTIENCGVYPWSFDEFTVTFDSDGGSTVPDQKLLNSPAVKPADPTKSGYKFDGWYLGDAKYNFDTKVTSNITLKAQWKKTTDPTIEVIDMVEINNVTVSFKDGDKPVFTGSTPDGAHYMFRCEWWELDSTTGLVSTEPEWGSDIYKNKISAFEAGKTYHYGVYVTAEGDVGNTRYVFGPDTKLKINGKFVNYKRYEGDKPDFSDGTTMSMWVLTDLAMTPEAGGTTPSGNKPGTGETTGTTTSETTGTTTSETTGTTTSETTGTKTGDTSNMALWIALLLVSGGAAIGTTVVGRKKKYNR